MPHKGTGLLNLQAQIPSEEEATLTGTSGALLAAAGQIDPQDPFTAVAKGVATGIGLTKGVQAGEAKSERLNKINEIIGEHQALADHAEILEDQARQLKAQEAQLARVGTSVATSFIKYTQDGNLEELRGNLSAPAEEILRQQGTSLADLSFADGNPTQVIITGKDGSITRISAFQIADVVRKSNPELADTMLASLGGFNKFQAEAQLKADAAAAFGAEPEQAGRIALGVEQPVQRQQIQQVGPEGFDAVEPTKPVQTQLQKKIIAADEAGARLELIQKDFDPRFLTFMGEAKAGLFKFLDKLDPDFLKAAEKAGFENPEEFLKQYSRFTQNAIENINLYIKEITGAQMSEPEADRLRKAAPDPERDSPTVFKAKLDNSIGVIRSVRARAAFALQNGIALNPDGSLNVDLLSREIAIPISKEDFDIIPIGSKFVNPSDGQVMRKK